MKLRTISPIHVGDGEEIIPWEYSVTGRSFSYYPVERITEGLRRNFSGQRLRNMLIRLRDEVRNYGFKKSLGEFLRENSISIEPIYTLPLKADLKKENSYKGVKSFIKSAEGAYVPGSEIKGALRTVFIFGVIYRDSKAGVWDKASREIQGLIFLKNAPSRQNPLKPSTLTS